ncbi:TPA: PTS glucose transporter subunit IIA [Streptococcus suis]|nr:PTS glucose transporter subunit IIA [Streptococcus suis]
MNTQKLAQSLVDNIGGKDNIQDLTHCFTRLRFVLKDNKKANKQMIERLEGVIQVVEAGGQFQVVIGSKVTDVYDAVVPLVNLNGGGNSENTGTLGNQILQTVSKMFTPLIPAIAASGLISGILTAVKLLMAQKGIDITTNDTYVLLYAASQIIFYFMPIFLGYTAAKALKANEFIAMTIGGFLCYPAFDALVQKVDVVTTFFGLPVIKGAWTIGEQTKAFSYTGSVIPIILAVLVLAYLEKLLKKYTPEILQIILVPGLALIIMLPLTLTVLGPVGVWVGNIIQVMYTGLMNFNAVLGGSVIGGLWGIFVIFGAHRALLPIGLNDVAVSGKQNLLAFAGAANFSQGGAALGVALKTKNSELKSVAGAATISAAIVGITEPAIYGTNLRLKRPMIAAIIAGTIGGGIMGLGGVYGDAFANNGVLTIFTYAAGGITKFIFYLVGCLVAYVGAAVLTYVMGFEDLPSDSEPINDSVEVIDGKYELPTVTEGEVISLEKVNDLVFSSGALGQGVGIISRTGQIVAPANGVLTLIYPTKHAIGFTLDNGIELLIHIGINTVELEGKHFNQEATPGMKLKRGDAIVSFDIEEIKAAGYDPTVIVVIANSREFKSIVSKTNSSTYLGDTIMEVEN